MMAVSPAVRAAIIDWVIEWYETHISYRFFGESNSDEMPSYNIVKLPSGYKKLMKSEKLLIA